jgi:hypothetical protein
MNAASIASRNWARLLTGELGLAVSALLLSTMFMLGLLRWYFPEGTGIESADLSRTAPGVIDRAAALGFASAGPAGEPQRIGTLAMRRKSVQSRSSDEVDWRDAATGTVFYERDALQTGPGSYAAVRNDDGSQLRLGERSLVVFEGATARFAADYTRPVALVMRGELSGELAGGAGPSTDILRINGGALSLAAAAGAAAEYSVRINENDSATISIRRGQARYASSSGVTDIAERQSLTVDERGQRVALVDLPRAPALDSPRAGARIDGRGPTAVDFAWQPVAGVEGYRIVIAYDRELADRLTDEQVTGTRFHHGGLPPGDYFWAVQGRIGWTLGDFAAPRQLSVAKDDRAPELVLDDTPRVVNGTSVTISGRTDPDARVYVGGQPADNSGGMFRHVTQLAAGANVIVVESVDSVGNVAYASVMVVAN